MRESLRKEETLCLSLALDVGLWRNSGTSKTNNSSLVGLASRLYINESYEYKLRRELLTNMDVMVRPVESPSDIVSVDFSMTIRSLSDLVSQNPNGKKSHY